MRTFLHFIIVIDPRRVELAVPDSTQTRHTKNIQAFHYNRTLFVADDRRTRLLRGRSIALLSSSSPTSRFQLANEQEVDPFPDWGGLKCLQKILHEQGGRGHARLSFSWLSASAHVTTRRPLQLFRLVAVLFELHRHAGHARPRTSVLLQQTIADAPAKFAISP